MGYKTGIIQKVPLEKNGLAVDGIISGDDGTPYKFRWPREWAGENSKKMSRGARVKFFAGGGRARGLKKSFARSTY